MSWAKRDRRWEAAIRHHGQKQHLGLFSEEVMAAHAFDTAARQLRGDEAYSGGRRDERRLNFPTKADEAAIAATRIVLDGDLMAQGKSCRICKRGRGKCRKLGRRGHLQATRQSEVTTVA